MKGIRISILLVLVLACIGASAQKKNVDAAWKLVGKTDGLAESRKLIKEAMAHNQTKDQARTWFVAAMIEWGSYDADVRKREINPKDLSVKDADMTAKLLDGYRYLLKALPLDSLPDRKGRVKPKYSAQILAALDGKAYDLYRAGAISYAAKNYYPQAYDGFMAAASLATNPRMIRAQRMLPDTLRREIYYYAGLSAYGGNEPRHALRAFNRAEEFGKDSAPMYLYSMAIWEKFARDSISLRDESRDSLLAISTRGYRRHGIRRTGVPEPHDADLHLRRTDRLHTPHSRPPGAARPRRMAPPRPARMGQRERGSHGRRRHRLQAGRRTPRHVG